MYLSKCQELSDPNPLSSFLPPSIICVEKGPNKKCRLSISTHELDGTEMGSLAYDVYPDLFAQWRQMHCWKIGLLKALRVWHREVGEVSDIDQPCVGKICRSWFRPRIDTKCHGHIERHGTPGWPCGSSYFMVFLWLAKSVACSSTL